MIDNWIKLKIGMDAGANLTRGAIERYQTDALRRTVALAKANSRYYAETLAGIEPERDILTLSDIAKLPLTDENALAERGNEMVCVPASGVSRIVTIPTSGTTGEPKRVWFTEVDQELMIDYVAHGLRVMVRPKEVFLILMPCERPGSVGDLVRIGLERFGVDTIPVGIIPADGARDNEILSLMRERRVNSMLATASAAARLAGKSKDDPIIRKHMRSILLSAEYVDESAKTTIETAWECEVFEHYGMTEMGLGGAMACEIREGYHAREADILFEIIDPVTEKPLPEGEEGEVVFTTLTREAMPFIRYRTGDISSIITSPCPCGSPLKRLKKVSDRKARKGY